jgi:hypothetical protein
VRERERERDRKREGRGSTSLGVSRPEWRVPRAHAIQIKTGPRLVMLAKRIARLEDCAWVVTRMGGLRMDRRTMGGASMHRSTMGLHSDHNTMGHGSQHEGTQLVFVRERVLRAPRLLLSYRALDRG